MDKQSAYSKEQIADIQEREQKGLEALKTLGLTPACQIVKERLDTNVGDIFADRLYPYLQDVKYVRQGDKYIESKPSPIQVKDL